MSTTTERVTRLRPGSRWQKPTSGKTYEIIRLVIDSSTNGATVLYRRCENAGHDEWFVLPVNQFLGDRLVDRTADGVSTYAPQFVPID